MAKQGKFVFVCQGCGYQTAKWMGRCTECGQWNSFVEERSEPAVKTGRATSTGHPHSIDAISLDPKLRFKTGIVEFDRTLGGGLVPGSSVLYFVNLNCLSTISPPSKLRSHSHNASHHNELSK